MKTIIQNLEDLNQLVLQGKPLEAFEKYYHDEVMMQENLNPPTVGKKANLEREKKFYSDVKEFRSAELKGVGAGENISFSVWKYDYTHNEWGIRDYTQVSVQHWKDGKIIHEQFFYGN